LKKVRKKKGRETRSSDLCSTTDSTSTSASDNGSFSSKRLWSDRENEQGNVLDGIILRNRADVHMERRRRRRRRRREKDAR
jgi:hypothetical protein